MAHVESPARGSVAVWLDGAHEKAHDGSRRRDPAVSAPSIATTLVRFVGAGVLVTVALVALTALVARQAATDDAVDEARRAATITAEAVVEPRLDEALLAGDPAALTTLDLAIHRSILRETAVRVKLWAPDGRILYSDEPRLIGQVFPLDEDETAAMLGSGSWDSDISDHDEPEDHYEQSFGTLLEVYVGLRDTTDRPVLFEAYFTYDSVADAATVTWRRFAPLSIAGLLVLELLQIPFAWSLVRRVQEQQRQRVRLLRHAVTASSTERRRIAADLHDGVVQELSGLTYHLDAVRLGDYTGRQTRAVVEQGAETLRHSVDGLRSLLLDLYPPDVAGSGLGVALTDLAAGLRQDGIRVVTSVAGLDDVPRDTGALLYRAAVEATRNIARHSGASCVTIRATVRERSVSLVFDDDGRGFDRAELDGRRAEGHVGLRAMGDLLTESGGHLTVRSSPGEGTRLDVEVSW